MTPRYHLERAAAVLLQIQVFLIAASWLAAEANAQDTRPNILFAIADDWGWPHAGAYGDPVVKTPAFDQVAASGVLFSHAFVSSPSCTPSRGAILSGQYHWRLQASANLYGPFPDSVTTFPELLGRAGYQLGVSGKGWGPGKPQTPDRQLIGKKYREFTDFIESRDPSKPFFFWLGSSDPHRPYELGSGKVAGMDLDKIRLPACFPDSTVVRGDVADYYFEVQRFDRLVGEALKVLDEIGELDNTIVVVTGDHGMPFPRCKSNLYDTGTRVPLAISWPSRFPEDLVVSDFVSLVQLAPTFLREARVAVPENMSGRSIMAGGRAADRDRIVFGKERHVPAQEAPDLGGYPSRALRTREYLLIHNYKPDRWPNGTPHFERAAIPGNWYADTDNGPTKSYMIDHREHDDIHRQLYDLAFAKRPEYELYDLKKDPQQLVNVATAERYAVALAVCKSQLSWDLRASKDPRSLGDGYNFDAVPYTGGGPKHPDWKNSRR